ncbi:hypothetical protein [Asaia prunellae]|uniref:hypothetical protein n=1 Tax=Asaia prunellae TaxID=610245 RepID=UPI00047157F9|nr:hypothetical protein [Asaia prunellae]
MSHFIKTGAAALGIVMLGTTPLMAQTVAQNAPQSQQQALSPAMRADIETGLRYTLPGDFLPRAAETLQALQAANIRPPNSTRLSLQQTISQIASTPGVPEILNAHGFTPESFTMGITAFGMTLAATNGQTLPAGFPAPNPSNVALFHTHPEQVTALMQAMGTPPGQN